MSKEYNDQSIRTMTGTQHFRAKASMYGFQVGTLNGLYLMFKEVIDNSTDESAAMDQSVAHPIDVTFFVAKDKSTYQCLVRDHGRGIPVGKLVDCLATANTSGKYDLDSYGAASTGTNGVGSKVVSALSKKFVAFTKRPDGFASLTIEKGDVVYNWKTNKTIDKDRTTDGTTVLFQPDPEIMQAIPEMFDTKTSPNGFEAWLATMPDYMIFHRNSLLRINVVEGLLKPSDIDITKGDSIEVWRKLTDLTNFTFKTVYQSDPSMTVRQYVIDKFGLKQPCWDLGVQLFKPQDIGNIDDRLSYDVDIFLDEHSLNGDNGIIGAVNATPINDQNSVHFTMLQTVVKMYLEGYVTDSEKKIFFNEKYCIPFSGCVAVGWLGAGFDGQDKSRFTDRVFGDFFRSHIRRQLNKVPEATWDRLFELITDHFEMAYAKYSKSQYHMNKNLKGIGYLLKRAGSYIPCKSSDSDMIELFIVEGDSAAGRVKTARCADFQAIYKLRGKPINAIRASAKDLVKDIIFQDMTELIGVRPTDTDLSNMRFKRIIILTDADADGYHIVSLLIGIIKRINEKILEEGRLFIANPPLYALRVQGQKRPLYLRDANALLEAKSVFCRTLLDIYVKYGKQPERLMNDAEYRALYGVVEMIGDRLKYVSDQMNIDPFIMEQLMFCAEYLDENNVQTEKILDIMKDAGVEKVVWDKDSNSIVLVESQGLDRMISLSRLKQTIQKQLLPMYERAHWRQIELFVTTRYTDLYVHTPCSFMMLYIIFKRMTDTDNSKYFSLTRFKGLGEMSVSDIEGTCINKSRVLSQIVGVGDVDVIYSMLGVESEARKQLTNKSVHGRLVDNGFLED